MLTYAEIAERHGGVGMATVSKWFKDYGIDVRLRHKLAEIGGKKYKRCYGPNHPKGGELLPLEKFWKNAGKKNSIQPRCAQCMGGSPRIPYTVTYQQWVESIYRRLGFSETVRRLGISEKTLTIWRGLNGKTRPKTLKRQHAAVIVTVLGELRITGEVRHRKSIHRGATVRGEIERPVRHQSDLLVRHGDNDNEYKRKYRERPGVKEKLQEHDRERNKQRRLTKRQAA